MKAETLNRLNILLDRVKQSIASYNLNEDDQPCDRHRALENYGQNLYVSYFIRKIIEKNNEKEMKNDPLVNAALTYFENFYLPTDGHHIDSLFDELKRAIKDYKHFVGPNDTYKAVKSIINEMNGKLTETVDNLLNGDYYNRQDWSFVRDAFIATEDERYKATSSMKRAI